MFGSASTPPHSPLASHHQRTPHYTTCTTYTTLPIKPHHTSPHARADAMMRAPVPVRSLQGLCRPRTRVVTTRASPAAAAAASCHAPPGALGETSPKWLRRGHATAAASSGSLVAWFVRGGTSNGLVFRRDHLPPENQWHTVLPAAMGSPDPYGRQLDGMGSGASSTSKVVVLGPPSRPDVDVDFTFVQVGIKEAVLDMAGNCGNMSSIVGPAAWDQGMVSDPVVEHDEHGHQIGVVRFLNTNTNKVVVSRFRVSGNPPMFCPDGDYAMDGVPGTGSKIVMSFMHPAGAKTGRALPTGNPIDVLHLTDGSQVRASLVDVGNPGVFISTESIGLGDDAAALTPRTVEADAGLKSRLEEIRRAGASAMGLDPEIQSVPKIVLLFPRSGSAEIDVSCLAMSMGQAHKAVPLTLALCLGAASQMQGTIAWDLIGGRPKETVTIGHPSGRLDVGTTMRDGEITSAQLLRTARVMMKGEVLYRR